MRCAGPRDSGLSTLYLHDRHPSAKVIAVEPDESNHRVLARNTSDCARIEVIRAAVWNDAAAKLSTDPVAAGTWDSRVAEDSQGSLRAVTMSELIARAKPGDRIAVKMDIEGAEAKVFASDTAWLDRIDLFMIALHEDLAPGSARLVHESLLAHGFIRTRAGAVAVDVSPMLHAATVSTAKE